MLQLALNATMKDIYMVSAIYMVMEVHLMLWLSCWSQLNSLIQQQKGPGTPHKGGGPAACRAKQRHNEHIKKRRLAVLDHSVCGLKIHPAIAPSCQMSTKARLSRAYWALAQPASRAQVQV